MTLETRTSFALHNGWHLFGATGAVGAVRRYLRVTPRAFVPVRRGDRSNDPEYRPEDPRLFSWCGSRCAAAGATVFGPELHPEGTDRLVTPMAVPHSNARAKHDWPKMNPKAGAGTSPTEWAKTHCKTNERNEPFGI